VQRQRRLPTFLRLKLQRLKLLRLKLQRLWMIHELVQVE
jgi:hypothetical protein